MSTLEIKRALHDFIDTGDDKFIKMFYQMAKAYRDQLQLDKMIAEGESDISAGRVHSQAEVQKMIEGWTEK